MALPAARLTRKQIRDLACRKAGNAALSDTDAIQYLQLLLDADYEQYEWPFLFTTISLTLTSSTFSLPIDFLKMQDDSSFFQTTFDGAPLQKIIEERDRDTFVRESTFPATSGSPSIWTADRNQAIGFLYPDPSGHVIAATFRYKFLPASQINSDGTPLTTEPTDIPVFPYHHLLVQQLFALILLYEGDPRSDGEGARADAMMQRALGTANPLRAIRSDVPLDPELFKTPFRSDSGTWGSNF